MGLVAKLWETKNIITFLVKRLRNSPDSFMFISKDDDGNYVLPQGYSSVTEVGGLQDVVHLTLHNMMPHTVNCQMTDLRYLHGQDANAVYVDLGKFTRIDQYLGRSYFQPLKLVR